MELIIFIPGYYYKQAAPTELINIIPCCNYKQTVPMELAIIEIKEAIIEKKIV